MSYIADYMTEKPVSVPVDATIEEAAQAMQLHNIGSLLIKDGEEFVGIVTQTDFSQKVVSKGMETETTSVSEIMTSPMFTMDRYSTIEEANAFMRKHRIGHLGVTDDDKIVGILSISNLLNYFTQRVFRMSE
jgi:signal-transduction protein with cAMP-binding, CBS, and nucleotidyltransferase domain